MCPRACREWFCKAGLRLIPFFIGGDQGLLVKVGAETAVGKGRSRFVIWDFTKDAVVNRGMKRSCGKKLPRQGAEKCPERVPGRQNYPEKGARLSRACLTRFKTFMRIELFLGHNV